MDETDERKQAYTDLEGKLLELVDDLKRSTIEALKHLDEAGSGVVEIHQKNLVTNQIWAIPREVMKAILENEANRQAAFVPEKYAKASKAMCKNLLALLL